MKKLIAAVCLILAAGIGVRASEKIVFSFDHAKPRPVPPYFLGAGTEFIYSVNHPKAVLNRPERLPVLRALKLQALRGPAGTIANYYLWKKGYFFTPAEPDYGKYYKKKRNENKGPGPRPILLPELMEEAGKLDVPYIFNTNVDTQSPEEIADLVRAMKKQTRRPIFLEMGNELFEPGDDPFPTCREYIAKVRAIAKAVKAVDPAARIGVVCPAYPFSEAKMLGSALRKLANTNNKPIDRYLDWDDILAANQDAFDAVILHPYIFFRPENSTPESLMAFMFAWNAADEEVMRTDYARMFPGKKLWITEFNVLSWRLFRKGNPLLRNRVQLMKSPGAAIANMDTLMRFIAVPDVELTCLHTLEDGQGFGIIQYDYTRKKLVPLPNYYVYEAVGALLAEHPCYYRLDAAGAPSRDFLLSYTHVSQGPEEAMVRYREVGAWGFGSERKPARAVFCNRTPFEQTVGLSGARLRQLWSYGGRDPFPGFLRSTTHWTNPPEQVPEPDRKTGDATAELRLPPYSMTIAEVTEL